MPDKKPFGSAFTSVRRAECRKIAQLKTAADLAATLLGIANAAEWDREAQHISETEIAELREAARRLVAAEGA